MKTLFETEVTATGGREGQAKSKDGHLQVKLAFPPELGGPKDSTATNPEQLFAAGYAACFESALRLVARNKKVTFTATSVTARVSLLGTPEGGFKLAVGLRASIPGVDPATAQGLVEEAHKICPYSNATRGNIDVSVEAV